MVGYRVTTAKGVSTCVKSSNREEAEREAIKRGILDTYEGDYVVEVKSFREIYKETKGVIHIERRRVNYAEKDGLSGGLQKAQTSS